MKQKVTTTKTMTKKKKTNPSESTLQFAYLILYGYCVPLMYYIARIKFRIIDTFTRFNGCE